MEIVNVLSLFDGMACGMLAMQAAGIPVSRYVAFEIDKYAVQTSTHNFPMIEQRGDVFTADFTEFLGFDFLIGGSPCTYWSIAQNNNRETEASGMGWELFSQYVRALREAQPRYFVYENNKSMSNAIRESITQTFGFEPVCINSALVSAQNRQRLYWVGRRNEDGTYSRVNVEQPEDRGILLADILESGGAAPLSTTPDGKSFCITATEYKGSNPQQTLTKHRRTMVAEPVCVNADGKAHCLAGNRGGHCLAHDIKKSTYSYAAENVPGYATPCEWDEEGKATKATSGTDGKTYIVYEVKDGFYIIRKLTVRECMRLQTVPEWYAFPVSDTQAYKMLGNGWTVEVIAHLLNACMPEVTR